MRLAVSAYGLPPGNLLKYLLQRQPGLQGEWPNATHDKHSAPGERAILADSRVGCLMLD